MSKTTNFETPAKTFWEISEFLANEFNEPQAYCQSLIYPKGMMVVGGEPKSGKSNFVFNLAFALGSGSPFLNFDIPCPYRVLVIQAELSDGQFQERLQMIKEGWDDVADKMFVRTLYGAFINEKEGFEIVKDIIDKANPDVIVIDPLVEFYSGNENDAQELGHFLDCLRRLIDDTNRSIIISHHCRKPSRDGGNGDFHSLRGSSVLSAKANSVIMIQPEMAGQVILDFTLRHAPKPDKMIASFDNNLVIKYLKQAGAKKVHDTAIIDLLKEAGKSPMKDIIQKVAEAADCTKATVGKHVRELIEAGKVKKEGSTNNATIELVCL